jgi:ABC-type proline/glycine betaine transport system permease subunit
MAAAIGAGGLAGSLRGLAMVDTSVLAGAFPAAALALTAGALLAWLERRVRPGARPRSSHRP